MRRTILSALFAAFAILVTVGVTPALAHEASFTAASDGDKDRDKDARAEAGQLTDELKAAATRPAKLPAVQAAVTGKAERRRELLNRLAESNPAAVLDLALTPAERAALPSNIRASVEERVNVDGELQVLHHDFEDGHSAYESKLVKGGKETPVRFGATLGKAKPGDQVKTSGVALSGTSTVVTDQMVVVQSGQSVGTTGPQHTAIILVKVSEATPHFYTDKAYVANLFFDSSAGAKSARAFYLEQSYGQTTITGANGAPGSAGDVYGPYVINVTSCSTATRDAALLAADRDIDYSAYQRVVLSITNSPCGSAGIGSIGTQGVGSYDGGNQRLSISWDFNGTLGSTSSGKIGGVALHEYGHNVGVWHANALECGESAINSATCTSDEYGDLADVMGSSGGYGHFNGIHKDILGWLTGRKQIVSDNGSYPLNPYEDGSVNTKVLMVPRTRDGDGNVNTYYYLESRKPTTNWANYTSGRPEYSSGVLVHTSGIMPFCANCGADFYGPGGGGDSNIIDTQPGTLTPNTDFNDAPLAEGQSYTDPGAGVSMQVTSTEAGGATVALTFSAPIRSIQTLVYPENVGTVSGGGAFTPGQSVTLTASPAGCFQYWRENRTRQVFPNPYTFTVSADRTLEAIFLTGSCGTPPANDNFTSGATAPTGQYTVNTTGATTQTGEPLSFTCDSLSVVTGRTAWYTITPATTSQITLTTVGSNYDTVLGIFSGNAVSGLTPVACNDDVSGDTTSRVQFTGQAGTSYRVQLGGYNADGGNGVLNVTTTATESDVRQEGPIQVTGNLTVGGSATIAVAVKNYGTVPTPALHPFVDGTGPASQSWRANSPQPASATIQPGQTVTFTLQQQLSSPGAWTTTSVSLWNDTTNALMKVLPANGQSQQIGFSVTMNCGSTRPKIGLQTSITGDGRMAVTITAPAPETGNRLTTLQFGTDNHAPNPNALIDLPNVGNGRTAPSTVNIPGNPATYTFFIRRQAAGAPVTLPVTVSDYCGSWQTVVGAGTGAGF